MSRIDWEQTAVVFMPQLRCPHCGADRPILTRSERQPQGDIRQKRVCRSCTKPFRAIIEVDAEVEILSVAEIRQTKNDID